MVKAEKQDENEGAHEDVHAETGGSAAVRAQAAGALMIAAIGVFAVAAHGAGQAFAGIAGGRLIFLGLLWPPPALLGLGAKRGGGDAIAARIARRDGGRAALAVVLLTAMLFT